MSDPEKLPPFPRACECPGYVPPIWCHGFFSGTMSQLGSNGNFVNGPAAVAVVEDAAGNIHTVQANWVSFRK